jgi:diadenylate cyclase
MPSSIIENLVSEFKDLKGVMNASIGQLDDVDGIGEIRAKNINDGLKRMREQTLFDIRF